MKPILYPPNETDFSSNGLGVLTDAISCIVTEARNGEFELQMSYPTSGIHYADIATRCLITAKPNPVDEPQPFRVYRITKPLAGMVTVYAQHISYDLSGIPVSPFTATSAAEALAKLKTSSAVDNPFTFWTDKATAATMRVAVPSSLRSLLGGQQGSVLDVYGGEYKFNRYQVRLYGQRGQDRGVSIRYGKNLTDLEQDENIAGVYTGVYPYWSDIDGNLVQLPEKILSAPGTYDFTRIMALDLSGEFQTPPTVAELRAKAEAYIKANNIGVPAVSLSVSFVQLEQTEEYKDLALLERVELCDTVGVEFPALGVSASAKCIRTKYDVLLNRYVSVELGDARTNLADTIAAQQQQLKQVPDRTFLQQAVDSATGQITGNKGGHVVLHSSTGSKQPDEILIMDTPDIATATKVWRWNKAGLGYSASGYNGPYGLAMTQDGAIVADFITTGILTANIIKTGILESINGASKINMDTGNATLTGSFESLRNSTSSGETRSHLDAGGFWTQKASGDRRGVYTNTSGQIISNTDSVMVAVSKEDSVWGRIVAYLNASNDGNGALGIKNKDDVRVLSASVNSENFPYLLLYGNDDKKQVDIFSFANGGGISLHDAEGRRRVYAGMSADNLPNIGFYNASGDWIGGLFQDRDGKLYLAIDGVTAHGALSADGNITATGNISAAGGITSGGLIKSRYGFSLRNQNDSEVGSFFVTSENKAHIKTDSITASGQVKAGSFYTTDQIVGDTGFFRELSVTGTLHANVLSVSDYRPDTVDTNVVYTGALNVDGLDYQPQRFVDKDGQSWLVLAVVDD